MAIAVKIHDQSLIKAMISVYWLVLENMPLSKYESLLFAFSK
jgi:hypothetical protein